MVVLQMGILAWSLFLIGMGSYVAFKAQLPNGTVIHSITNTRIIGALLVIGGLFISVGAVIALLLGGTPVSAFYVVVSAFPVLILLFRSNMSNQAQ
ncbi:MAG: hypothetical protein AAF846_09220 [Chloroflexota bacterium]